MQNNILHELVQEGCFVFQVVRNDKLRVRSIPVAVSDVEDDAEEEEEVAHFERNELLCCDMIQPCTHTTFGRLADQSGWVVVEERGELYLRQLSVETGLYCFYVDHMGISVRRHPMDAQSELLTTESDIQVLQPLQKIYCDRQVVHPVTLQSFYRLQNLANNAPATPGWVYDRCPENDEDSSEILLLPEIKVREGLFAYRAVRASAIRYTPDCTETSKTDYAIQAGELVIANLIRESPYRKGNGPFLRLADSTGWLFEKKQGEAIMEPITMESGAWTVKVHNEPVGLACRKQPIDSQDRVMGLPYAPGSQVQCDRKVTNDLGVSFYRVQGTSGWLFDRRDDLKLLEIVSAETETKPEKSKNSGVSWEPEFVRGIAATVPGATEIIYDPRSGVIIFETAQGIQVSIFCKTRSVGTTILNANTGKVREFRRSCTPRQLHQILCNNSIASVAAEADNEDVADANSRMEHKRHDAEDNVVLEIRDGEYVVIEQPSKSQRNKEEELRNNLIACEAEINEMHIMRLDLLKTLKAYDNERAEKAAKLKIKIPKSKKEGEEVREAAEFEQLVFKNMPKPATTNGRTMKTMSTKNSILEYPAPPTRNSRHGGDRGRTRTRKQQRDVYDSSARSSRSPSSESCSSSQLSGASSEMSPSGSGTTASRSAALLSGEYSKTASGKYSRQLRSADSEL